MAVTVNGFTWNVGSSDVGMFCTTNSSNDIGIRNCLYNSTAKSYGSSHIFFDLSYTPQNNGKLKISVNNVTATNDMRTHFNWSVSGTIKANGVTIFNGGLTSSDGSTRHGAGVMCPLTGGSTTSGVIDYNANSQGNISITYECNFSIIHHIELVYPAGSTDGWTNSGGKDSNAHSITYSHTHNLTTTTTSYPTCTTTGSTRTSCSSCEYSYTTILDAIGHSYTDATCTSPKTCSVCGGTEGKPLGHNWDSGVVTTPSTYEATGIKTHTCSRCSETKEEILAKLIVSVYIDNGETLDEYSIYIDDGEEWHPYILYIDDGEKFVAYC